MRDIFEAVEKLSIVLGLRIENAMRKRGWAGKPAIGRIEVNSPDGSIYPQHVDLPLPRGNRAIFMPDSEPGEGQATWRIQIKRNDGVVRRRWKDGLTVRKVDSGYQLFLREDLLSEPIFNQLLDELAGAGLSGHALTIAKAYTSRFGTIPADVYDTLISAQYVEQLERMHDAVLTGASEIDVQHAIAILDKFRP